MINIFYDEKMVKEILDHVHYTKCTVFDAILEISEQKNWAESEFIKKFKSFNDLMIKETNIMPLSVCIFDNALVVKSIHSLNCD